MELRCLTARLACAALATGIALLTMTSCAQDAPTAGEPSAPTPPRSASAIEPAAETETEPSKYTLQGGLTEIELVYTRDMRRWGLSKEAAQALEKPSCPPEGVDVAIEDGAGAIIALGTLNEPKPINVDKSGDSVLWECDYTYTATVPAALQSTSSAPLLVLSTAVVHPSSTCGAKRKSVTDEPRTS